MGQKDWREQLADVRKELPPPLELRNDKEITRAVQHAEGELKANLELSDSESKRLIVAGLLTVVENVGLGQTKAEITKSIDELLATVTELDRAANDLVEGSRVQAREFFEELEALRTSVSPPITLAEVSEELRRRAEWSQKKGEEQEELQNRHDTSKGELRISKQEVELGGYGNNTAQAQKIITDFQEYIRSSEDSIQKIITALANNRREMRILENCKKALEMAENGWEIPKSLIGKNLD